jgi:hypothetical protein
MPKHMAAALGRIWGRAQAVSIVARRAASRGVADRLRHAGAKATQTCAMARVATVQWSMGHADGRRHGSVGLRSGRGSGGRSQKLWGHLAPQVLTNLV